MGPLGDWKKLLFSYKLMVGNLIFIFRPHVQPKEYRVSLKNTFTKNLKWLYLTLLNVGQFQTSLHCNWGLDGKI